MERLQKVIAASGYCSRRNAELFIEKGRVTVNGEVVTQMGVQVEPNDIIAIDGVELKKEQKVYILINKPRDCVCTVKDEVGRKTVLEYINVKTRVYPVGRLDYNTTGALILTNDGELTNLLIHPSSNVEKTYIAKVAGVLKKDDLVALQKGVCIEEGVITAPAKAKLRTVDKVKRTCIVELTIHEGRNHQVKRMFEAIEHKVIRLHRVTFANLYVDDLRSGEYRFLNPKEVKVLYSLANKPLKKD